MDKLKNIQLSTYEKIGIAWGLLVILLVIALLIRFFSGKPSQPAITNQPIAPKVTPTKSSLSGRLFISPSTKKVKLGESFTIDIQFTAAGKTLDGSDVVLRFNPNYLTADNNLVFGQYFDSYPRQEVDNENGIIKVSGYSPKSLSPLASATSFFSVTFQAKKKGSGNVVVDFQAGKTNLSTLVERGTSKNILGSVGNVKIVIE